RDRRRCSTVAQGRRCSRSPDQSRLAVGGAHEREAARGHEHRRADGAHPRPLRRRQGEAAMIRPAPPPEVEPGVPVLVDANVLMDVLTADEVWFDWSATALAAAGDRTVLVLNQIVYAEVSVSFPTIEALDEALPAD